MNISYRTFEEEFALGQEALEQAFLERDYLKTLAYLRFLAIGYYNVNFKMSDDRMEEITGTIARELLGEVTICDSDPRTVVLYDSIALFERVLAEIYVDTLSKLGYRVVLLMHENTEGLERFFNRYSQQKNVSIRLIPRSGVVERMAHIQRIVSEINPRHIFLHLKPQDVCGVGAFSTIKGEVTRYLIDLTDHAFWIGKCASDQYIGFRNYGCNVETQLRGIAPDKTSLLPYYPNSRAEYPFEGMPFDTEKYDYVFSGGWIYKIQGDTEHTYRQMVSHILDNYPKVNFVFAGKGTNDELDYLKEKYPGRFFQIPERKDLDEVMKRARLYLGTYPMCGGLMTQYALKNRCIPLCLGKNPNSGEDVNTLMLRPEKASFVFYQKNDLLAELDHLMTDEQYYSDVRANLDEQIITEEEFAEGLQGILEGRGTKFKKSEIPLDLKAFLESYKNRATYALFRETIYYSHNKWVKEKYPEIIADMEREKQKEEL